ncbi:hypothetical protein L202_02230 [Cryptococcus amylolentus CBS 6039]|uniref:BHLH domain-containing protein n=1 Tax=Cryptococcus amylolentus CBS 6039 TaxID=1295533 RepID=A0A1E3HZY8_9TREE|nr:hypothetical protein L202_02230 [Cryptococcus amylolentus CBS 6039]ODN81880.1 hypothetical protein L202_02230 [Cryptococcus amylolentus CBS 6039]
MSLNHIDPALHPTLDSMANPEHHDHPPQDDAPGMNPLNEFAQQVLGREADAENLLDFGRGHSILGEEQSFNDILQAEGRRRDGEDDPSRPSHPSHPQAHHHHAEEDQLEGGNFEPENSLDQQLTSEELARGGARQMRPKRRRLDEVGEDGQPLDPQTYAKNKKDNHREVESRRRQNITDGINELSQLLPPGAPKEGKGQTLKRAVSYIQDMQARMGIPPGSHVPASSSGDVPTLNQAQNGMDGQDGLGGIGGGHLGGEEQISGQLRLKISHLETRLAEEQHRASEAELSVRAAEDRLAATTFELHRMADERDQLKAELERVKKELASLE